MDPKAGWKGTIWKSDIHNEFGRKAADAFLKEQPSYDPLPLPPPTQKKPKDDVGISDTAVKLAAFQLGHSTNLATYTHQSQPWRAVRNYSNTAAGTEMYYPGPQALNEHSPVGEGNSWKLPADMQDRSRLLEIERDPSYALRAGFFPNVEKKNIITNHFEYQLNTDTFYEYTILDLATKNRKKLRALFKSAIDNWTFLQQNEAFFATNYIDKIISWRPLHEELDEIGKDEGDDSESLEFGPYNISLGNTKHYYPLQTCQDD